MSKPTEQSTPAPTYWDYLKLDQLLALQGGVKGDEAGMLPDELHFIIVHQVYELWFKLVLRSMRVARNSLDRPLVDEQTIPEVVQQLRRVNTILRLAVQHFEVVETLTPQGFLDFRHNLVPASGFQSFQMRELEIIMGLEDAQRVAYAGKAPLKHIAEHARKSPAGQLAWEKIEQARTERTLLAVLDDWLYRTPIQGSRPSDEGDEQAVIDFLNDYLANLDESLDANLRRLVIALGEDRAQAMSARFEEIAERARAYLHAEDVQPAQQQRRRRIRAAVLFIESYRDLPLLSWPRLMVDMMVEMEEHLVLWRHRHVRMVERTIGKRVGTGGSSGVDYLDKTGVYRVFRDLWAIRTVMLPKANLPALKNAEFYGFYKKPEA